jgi:predicted metal-dependent hydrolase
MIQPSLFDAPSVGASAVADAGSAVALPEGAETRSVPIGPAIPVRVIRSKKRKRTVVARMVEGTLEVLMPAWMSKADEAIYVEDMVKRFERRERSDSIDLPQRANRLAREYGLPKPTSIRWAENMAHRWGSCTADDGTIRISSTLSGYPGWVLDSVIVHELAHLEVCDHSPAFWELANRYPRMERARGYLLARGGTDED